MQLSSHAGDLGTKLQTSEEAVTSIRRGAGRPAESHHCVEDLTCDVKNLLLSVCFIPKTF